MHAAYGEKAVRALWPSGRWEGQEGKKPFNSERQSASASGEGVPKCPGRGNGSGPKQPGVGDLGERSFFLVFDLVFGYINWPFNQK